MGKLPTWIKLGSAIVVVLNVWGNLAQIFPSTVGESAVPRVASWFPSSGFTSTSFILAIMTQASIAILGFIAFMTALALSRSLDSVKRLTQAYGSLAKALDVSAESTGKLSDGLGTVVEAVKTLVLERERDASRIAELESQMRGLR